MSFTLKALKGLFGSRSLVKEDYRASRRNLFRLLYLVHPVRNPVGNAALLIARDNTKRKIIREGGEYLTLLTAGYPATYTK